MLSYDDIKNYCSLYKVENGVVFEKASNKQITDENLILKIKTAILIFKEAKANYNSEVQQFGKTYKDQKKFIENAIERLGVNGEVNSYGVNKVVNNILNSNGHYEEFIPGKDLQEGKYSIFVPPKRDYGLAYLKLRFREKGLDITDFQIKQDLSQLQKNGVSKVIIDFKVQKYENIKTEENKKFEDMSLEEKESFMQSKMEEAKINKDEDLYNYWNANLANLRNNNRTQNVPKEPNSDYKYHYGEIMKLINARRSGQNLSSVEKEKMQNQIYDFERQMIKAVSNEQQMTELLTLVTEELDKNEWEQNFLNILIEDLQVRYKQIKPQEKTNSQDNSIYLSSFMKEFKEKVNTVNKEYETLKGKYYDENNYDAVMNLLNQTIKDGYALLSVATNKEDIDELLASLKTLEQKQDKSRTIQNKVEQTVRRF